MPIIISKYSAAPKGKLPNQSRVAIRIPPRNDQSYAQNIICPQSTLYLPRPDQETHPLHLSQSRKTRGVDAARQKNLHRENSAVIKPPVAQGFGTSVVTLRPIRINAKYTSVPIARIRRHLITSSPRPAIDASRLRSNDVYNPQPASTPIKGKGEWDCVSANPKRPAGKSGKRT